MKKVIQPDQLLQLVETRIPIQICTLEDGNIVPMINGKNDDHQFMEKLSIPQRTLLIDFGIIEKILLEEKDKKTMVVSIMGAQSTGKSYLMNRIFGSRFTVASSRTTIGIWISIVRTPKINYLALDC